MEDLIARLEAAAEGSIELDREIEAQLYPQHRTLIFRDKWNSPPRTRSLDAAVTLVPAGMWWTVGAGKVEPDEPLFGAAIYPPVCCSPDLMVPTAAGEHHSSAAIALCVAALKARATSKSPHTPDTGPEHR